MDPQKSLSNADVDPVRPTLEPVGLISGGKEDYLDTLRDDRPAAVPVTAAKPCLAAIASKTLYRSQIGLSRDW
jgi:hypothetical protein